MKNILILIFSTFLTIFIYSNESKVDNLKISWHGKYSLITLVNNDKKDLGFFRYNNFKYLVVEDNTNIILEKIDLTKLKTLMYYYSNFHGAISGIIISSLFATSAITLFSVFFPLDFNTINNKELFDETNNTLTSSGQYLISFALGLWLLPLIINIIIYYVNNKLFKKTKKEILNLYENGLSINIENKIKICFF